MAEQLGEAVLTVSADTRQLEAGLQRARQQGEQLGQSTEQAFTRSGKALQTAANGLQYYIDAQGRARDVGGRFVTQIELQAAGLQRVGAAATASAMQVESLGVVLRNVAGRLAIFETIRRILAFIGQQITGLDSVSAAVQTLGVNGDELKSRLRALSVELGNSISQIELTKAAYDVASSGFANAGDATQILRASVLGSKGGFAQLDDVVRATTGVLNAYGLSANEATKIVDGFIQTQNDGVLTLGQYANQVGDVASIAAAAGVSIQEVNAAIATATLKGVLLPQAVTGLRQALSSIINPSQQAAQLAASLGIQFNAAALKSKGLVGVLADVQEKTGGSAAQFGLLIPSVEAQAAILPLLNDKLVTYNKLLENQNKASGTAASAFDINSKTISGSLAQIGNGFSNLATTLDETLTPLFKGFLGDLNSILGKLNQVSALSPDQVKKRQEQAASLAESVVKNSPNYNIKAFGNTPILSALVAPGGFTLNYDGKTFKGGVGDIREQLVQYLLKKDLANANKPNANAKGNPKPSGATSPTGAVVSPAELDYIRQANALEQKGLQDKLALASQLNKLDELTALKRQNELNLNEKIRSVELARLQLQREQAKPIGSTGSPAEQDPKKLLDLQNKIQAGQVEIATQRIQNQQAEDQAFRKRREQQQTLALELRAFQQGPDAFISPTALLQIKLANMDVREAYAQAGKALVDNARNAASALKSAQQGFNSTARGGFQFLTPQLQQDQLRNARASVQGAVDRGLIRTGIDISSPEKLFQLAAFAEQIVPAQKRLEDAITESAKATRELVKKDWNIYLNGQTVKPPTMPVVSSEPVTFGPPRNPAAMAYGVFGGF